MYIDARNRKSKFWNFKRNKKNEKGYEKINEVEPESVNLLDEVKKNRGIKKIEVNPKPNLPQRHYRTIR